VKLQLQTDYLDPIEIDEYQWVSVTRTDGTQVTVFDDKVYIATQEDVLNHRDGRKVDG
jgi:hypothetical protein